MGVSSFLEKTVHKHKKIMNKADHHTPSPENQEKELISKQNRSKQGKESEAANPDGIIQDMHKQSSEDTDSLTRNSSSAKTSDREAVVEKVPSQGRTEPRDIDFSSDSKDTITQQKKMEITIPKVAELGVELIQKGLVKSKDEHREKAPSPVSIVRSDSPRNI